MDSPPLPHGFQEEINALHAGVCAGLADPNRIMILYLLADAPKTVSEMARALGVSQPLVSRHLTVLKERGMVRASRRGNTVDYTLGDPRLIQALDLLRAFLRDQLSERALIVSHCD